MEKKIFILAQGADAYWRGKNLPSKFKQLIPMGDKTIITRTISLLKGEDITVIAVPELLSILPKTVKTYTYKNPGTVLRGIWLTQYGELQWDAERTIILFGDVVFSRFGINTILEDSRTLSFYGRDWANFITGKESPELFGIAFSNEVKSDTCMALYWLWRAALAEKRITKLWTLYYYINNPNLLVQFNDYTDDVDSPDEYNSFWSYLANAAMEDDKDD
jgi:hypothetical protein